MTLQPSIFMEGCGRSVDSLSQPSIAIFAYASMTWHAPWTVWRVMRAYRHCQRGSGVEVFSYASNPLKPSRLSIIVIKMLIYISYFIWIVDLNYPSTVHNPPFHAISGLRP